MTAGATDNSYFYLEVLVIVTDNSRYYRSINLLTDKTVTAEVSCCDRWTFYSVYNIMSLDIKYKKTMESAVF